MNIEAKPRTLVAVVVAIVIVVGGYFYLQKTKPERMYKAEIHKLRLVEEHQRLEIEVMKQRALLDAQKKATEAAIPKMRLVPDEDPNQ